MVTVARRIAGRAGIAALAWLAAASLSAAPAVIKPGSIPGSMPEPEKSLVVNTGTAWGGNDLAMFSPDEEYEGLEGALKVEQDYGATMWAYNFAGFKPGSTVQVDLDVYVDCLENASWVELFWRGGNYLPSQEDWDRLGDEHKWAVFGKNGWDWKMDSNGRDEQTKSLGSSTKGWRHVRGQAKADKEGKFYVVMQMGHWEMQPPFVEAAFANLVVSQAK